MNEPFMVSGSSINNYLFKLFDTEQLINDTPSTFRMIIHVKPF